MTHYELLGIEAGASEIEIKRAYRLKAKHCHPDKVPGREEEFAALTEAYNTLLDQQKRTMYDARVIPAKKSSQRKGVGSSVVVSLNVTAAEIARHAKRTIVTTRQKRCSDCDGTGSKLKKASTCPLCQGTGRGSAPTIAAKLIRKPCVMCQGLGRLPEGSRCPSCKGKGLVPARLRHELTLHPLMTDRIVIPGVGNDHPTGNPGGLVIMLNIEADPVYKIKGLNLERVLEISPAQAVLGDKIEMDVFGRKVKLEIPPGTQNWQLLEKWQGGLSYDGQIGTLFVRTKILIPQFIDEKTEKLYKKILRMEKGLTNERTNRHAPAKAEPTATSS